MGRRLLGAGIALGVLSLATPALASGGVFAQGTSSGESYPVEYSFVANIVAAPSGPDAPPPGANNWHCKPSAAHPYPVVLVHGLLANETDNWQTMSPLLADLGYCVFTLTYGQNPGWTFPPLDDLGGLQPMEQSALVLAAFVDRVLAATRAHKVDMVGHSEGATMPYWYIKFDGGAAKVARFVGLAPVVHGTDVGGTEQIEQAFAGFGVGASSQASFLDTVCAACAEFAPDSAFIEKLDAGGITMPGVVYTQIMTRYDELVEPYTSGVIVAPNSTNIVVQNQCSTDFTEHATLASDPVAAQDVVNALDPSHAKPVVCSVVLPVLG